jgi:hypothetical protein
MKVKNWLWQNKKQGVGKETEDLRHGKPRNNTEENGSP